MDIADLIFEQQRIKLALAAGVLLFVIVLFIMQAQISVLLDRAIIQRAEIDFLSAQSRPSPSKGAE